MTFVSNEILLAPSRIGYAADMQQKFPIYWEGDRCENCGSRADITLPHSVAQAAGGDDSVDNLQALCARCHSQQSAPGHRLLKGWVTGVVRFCGCMSSEYEEYLESKAEPESRCEKCGTRIDPGQFIYVERRYMTACAACTSSVHWSGECNREIAKGTAYKCDVCATKSRRGAVYFTGMVLGLKIWGECIDQQLHEIRVHDWQAWFGEDPPPQLKWRKDDRLSS